jgi:predicted MFS family arabinose efflux permease
LIAYLAGGVLTDAWGWRANFFLPVPLAIIALIVISRTLHLPPMPKRAVKIDYIWLRNQSDVIGALNSFNVGLGWWF